VKLVSYASPRGARAGVLTPEGVIDVWDATGAEYSTDQSGRLHAAPGGLRAALEILTPSAIATAVEDASPAETQGQVQLLPPITDPQKIICFGLNYHAHAAEAGIEPPEIPTFFAKFANALAAPGETVTLPTASDKIDYEAEVAFVIGQRTKDVPEDQALDRIAGYTLLNDLSARDLQFATPQWIPGKVFDGSGPCGPWLVTPDEAGDPAAIEFALELNGQRMQEGSTADLIFAIPKLLAHLSTLMTLEPGDLISTGTPAGVGSTRDPKIWLADGDEIVVSSPTLGELRTTIAR